MPYAEAPWTFRGKALYQLQLVKESEARKHTPAELPLVSLFGYTLGGFYLARYSDSPVGAFDELVVISGLVWNFPTSCAWAARVYVNNSAARNHGRKDVGLPSRLASFDNSDSLPKRKQQSWWHKQSEGGAVHPLSTDSRSSTKQHTQASAAAESSSRGITVTNVERRHWAQPWRKNHERLEEAVCSLDLPDAATGWKGPRLKLSLPSFSGNTAEHPGLLQYACRLSTNIRPTAAARVHVSSSEEDSNMEVMAGVLGGRPVLALCFEDMEMKVHAPAAYKLKAPVRQLTTAAAV